MPDDRPTWDQLPPERQSLWNSLMGLAALAGLAAIGGLFLPIIPVGPALVVAGVAWFGARRAGRTPLGGLDWPILVVVVGVSVLLIAF